MRIDINSHDRLAYRVAAVIRHQGRILLHRADYEDFWVLPGGSCEFYEESSAAIQREFLEELSATVEVVRLLWVVENFFEYEGKRVHEIGMYYECAFTGDSKRFEELDSFTGVERDLISGKSIELIYQWFPIEALNNVLVKPEFLLQELRKDSAAPKRIVHWDR